MVGANGARYEGSVRQGQQHGHGAKIWSNGDKYTGEWRNGKKHGRGVYVWGNRSEWANNRYDGEWRNGKHHGRGVYLWANGDKCEGNWREDRMLGTGEGTRNGNYKKCYMDGTKIHFLK